MLLSMSELYIIQSGSLVQESRSTNGTSSFFRLVRDNCPPTRPGTRVTGSKMSAFVDEVCQRYKKYVQSHPEIVTQIESTIRFLSYLVPGIMCY